MTREGKRVAWVTGGGTGIGEAGAISLAADGWTVVVSGRRKDALDAVIARIKASGGEAEAIPLDVSKADDVQKAADQILAKHGRIDVLVNSAGTNVPKRRWADMPTALHPQTQMAFKFADEILPRAYGYPMKSRVPTKLGFKSPKYVISMEVTNDYKGGYWEDQGYNSFSGS